LNVAQTIRRIRHQWSCHHLAFSSIYRALLHGLWSGRPATRTSNFPSAPFSSFSSGFGVFVILQIQLIKTRRKSI
jgi:hypothetical protein